MTRAKIVQEARRCIFCGEKGISREHLWSEWMAPLLPDSETSEIKRANGMEPLRIVKMRQGGIKKAQILGPCETCNNGWMGQLEEDVRPILEPMIRSEFIGVSRDQQQILAHWVTVKAMVLDQNHPPDMVVTAEDRLAFYLKRTIPEWVTVYVAQCGDAGWRCASYRQSVAAALGEAPPEGTQKNVSAITIGMGEVLLHVTFTKAKLPIDDLIPVNDKKLFRVWPYTGSAYVWPFRERLSRHDAVALGKRIDALI